MTYETSYAPVAPLETLRVLAAHGELGNYQLLIAPIVLDRAYAYEQFFRDHPDQTVILDNGVIELGHPLPARQLAQAAAICGADVVVLPDTIDNSKATITQVRRTLPDYRRMDPTTSLMGVVQGVTYEECLWAAEQLVMEGVNWLAIPRGLTKNLKTRVPLVQELALTYKMPMHVLGFSDNIKDDIEAAACSKLVHGIDAATPTWAPILLPAAPPDNEPETLSLGRRPENYWTMPDPPRVAPANVRTVRAWLSTAVAARTQEPVPAALQDL